ncbi:MAG: hypothetical protein A2Z99_13670 [Treponema sp. GWB1_62_6]|nr:MAG: hypothetical protein A2Z99_13670 [Treponema sp. GWB1_62_6]OHE67008.1 MAG: hypothetical protein A2001_08165 [Treponema sp. GWC1_61_84]HCM27369.1 hypothetical protein [Treponema sp.]
MRIPFRRYSCTLLAAAASFLAVACMTARVPETVLELPARGKPTEKPTEARPSSPDAGLDDPVFSSLDPEAKAYLVRLARAFSERDAAFLLSQGERDYAGRVRPMADDEWYFALLYRLGSYSSDSEATDDKPLRVSAESIASLRFTGMERRGPVAELRGVVALTDGTKLPCRIFLLWRLMPPRILGREP